MNNNNPPFSVKAALISLLVFLIGFIMLVSDKSDDFTLFYIGLAGIAVFFPMVYFDMKKINKEMQQAAQDTQAKELRKAFYEKCKKYNITRISTAEEKSKAKAIAESLNCPPEAMADLSGYLEIAKKELQAKDDAAHQATLDVKRSEEKSIHAKLTQYANYTGKEKRIAMLEAQRAAYLEKAASLRGFSQNAMSMSQQKEIDWATRGGIASGLAGGAAGVAAAMDAQAKNAEIRARNSANLKAMAPLVLKASSEASDNESAARRMSTYIDQAKTKIINSTSKDAVVKKLSFTNPKITVSSTGAISIKVSAHAAEPVLILGEENGVIDGTVLAEFYEGKRLAGTAELVLPMWGLDKTAHELEGICLSGGKKGITYRVEYKAKHLWEIEK